MPFPDDEEHCDVAVPVLVIGCAHTWRARHATLPDIPGFHFAGFRDLDAGLLGEVAPTVVLSALTSRDFDVLDLAVRLATLGFRGRYRALARYLPNPAVVVREVRDVAPFIDFDVLFFSP